MSERMVFIICRDGGYEGFSEPLEAFETEELANLFVKGAEAGYCSQMKVFALYVNEPKDFEYSASKPK
jgi:hypothetical protein